MEKQFNTLREYAQYYNRLRLFVVPHTKYEKTIITKGTFANTIWQGVKYIKDQTLEDVNSYDWESTKDVCVICGKKGIRTIRVENQWDYYHSNKLNYYGGLLEYILNRLGLPEDYEWVILHKSSSFEIIIDSNIEMGATSMDYKLPVFLGYRLRLNLQGDLISLPSISDEKSFRNNKYPTKHPLQISIESIRNLVKDLTSEYKILSIMEACDAIDNKDNMISFDFCNMSAKDYAHFFQDRGFAVVPTYSKNHVYSIYDDNKTVESNIIKAQENIDSLPWDEWGIDGHCGYNDIVVINIEPKSIRGKITRVSKDVLDFVLDTLQLSEYYEWVLPYNGLNETECYHIVIRVNSAKDYNISVYSDIWQHDIEVHCNIQYGICLPASYSKFSYFRYGMVPLTKPAIVDIELVNKLIRNFHIEYLAKIHTKLIRDSHDTKKKIKNAVKSIFHSESWMAFIAFIIFNTILAIVISIIT